MPPRRVIAYISVNTRMSALKNVTFPDYKFRKGQYVVYPIKLSCFTEKMKFMNPFEYDK